MTSWRGLCTLGLITFSAFAGDRFEGRSPREIKADLLARHRPAPAASTAKTIVVDCAKGDRIQDAIDKNALPAAVEIRGVCSETVLIESKTVTLRGSDANADAIQGGTAPGTLVTIRNAVVTVENLGMNASAGAGMTAFQSNVTLTRVRFANNIGSGMNITGSSYVNATEAAFVQNRRGFTVQLGSTVFCHGCTFQGNTTYAASAFQGGFFTLLNSTVTGRRGLAVDGAGAYGDIDCFSETPSPYPCSLNVTGTALAAAEGGNGYLYGAGDFTGALESSLNGNMVLHGARQLAAGQPGQGPARNSVDTSSTLYLETAFENDAISQIAGTDVITFSRLIVGDDTNITGNVQCLSGGDAWFQPSVTKAPGVTATGCAHGALP